MPKRKHKNKKRHIARKIRRLEERLDRCSSDSSSDYEDDYECDRYNHTRSPTPPPPPASDSEIPILPLSDSDDSVNNSIRPKSVIVPTNSSLQLVVPSQTVQHASDVNTSLIPEASTSSAPIVPPNPAPVSTNPIAVPANTEPAPSTSAELPALPPEILEALGDPKVKDEIFGPKIPEEIAKRWGRVLLDGLTKEQKQQMSEKYLIPDNFRLAKAPLLNPEIIPVLSEAARNRDKLMEKSQNQLGRGIAELTNLASTIIREDLNKIEILKKISEISQIFLDLHYEDTKRRRKLITSSLDKKFLHMITEVKRDTYLFGTNLGEKIRASKTAERSGLQIKRNDGPASSARKYPKQGNWKGPSRTQGQRAHRPGGQRGRYPSQQSRRPAPAAERPARAQAQTIDKTQKS